MLVCLCKYLTLLFKSTSRDYHIYPSTFRVVCHSTPKNSSLSCALKPCTMTMITLPIDGVTDVATVALSCQPSLSLTLARDQHGQVTTASLPWWSSSAGWSDEPHRELPSRGPQNQYHAKASGGWNTCRWNLPGAPGKDPSLSSVPENRNTSTRIQHIMAKGNIFRKFNCPPTPLSLYMLSTNLQTRQGVMGFPFWSVGITVGYLYTQTPCWAPFRHRSTVII